MHSISPREAERRAAQQEQSIAARRLPPNDAATYCGVSTSFLNKLRCVGGGPIFIKMGRRVVYSTDDLDDWLTARRRTSTSDTAEEAA
jgi:hypothetical protein